MSAAPKLRNGSPAHKVMVEHAKQAKQCAVRMLEEGSRDYEVLRTFVEQYIEYQHAADVVSGQVQPPPPFRKELV